MTSARPVLVWDRAGDPAPSDNRVLLWRSHSGGDAAASVPAYLDVHAARIRERYLAFICELGETLIAGKAVIDHLDPGQGFSFWWMTTLAEKSPLKSPRIYDCLRLFALEEMLAGGAVAALMLDSADDALADALRAMCQALGIPFLRRERSGHASSSRVWNARRLYEALPSMLRGLVSLRHVLFRWPLRRARTPPWFSDRGAMLVCSYFIHLDPQESSRGRFHSGQWEDLPGMLLQSGWHLNWLQLFLFSAAVPATGVGLEWVRRFNADACHQGCHTFLDSYLTLPRVLRAARTWLWLCATSRRLREIPAAFRPRGSAVWLWPLLRDDWQSSLSGPAGMSNCLVLAQFDAVIGELPHQETGLYLCENQAWEKALLWCWRKYGHGRIIGVQHATAPFWHLYYYDDPRSLRNRTTGSRPMPDLLAVNGEVVWRSFVAAGYPEDRLVRTEALRYIGLAETAVARRPRACSEADAPVRVLVLGDLIPKSMSHLLDLLESALQQLGPRYEVTLKPHPGYTPECLGRLPIRIVRDPLARILSEFDVVIAANSTSAAVDAYIAGLPVIIDLDGDELNLSPLRGQSGVRFVSLPRDLVDALRASATGFSARDDDRRDLLFLDPSLPRWRRLLGDARMAPA